MSRQVRRRGAGLEAQAPAEDGSGELDPGSARAAELPAAAEPGARDADLFDLLWRSGLVNVWVVARREVSAYFVSPMGWAVTTFVVLLVSLIGYVGPVIEQQQASMASAFDFLANFLLLLLAPLYTMRLLAEEKRTGTLEVVLTAPVRDWELVAGKWLGAFLFFLGTIAFTLVYVALLTYYFPEKATVQFLGLSLHIAELDWGTILAGYIGLLLAGGTFLAFGLFTSSLTQNQIVAAVAGFVGLLVLWYVGTVLGFILQPPVGDFFRYLSGYDHYQSFSQGLLSLKDVVYFVSLLVGCLFLTTRVLESRKWR